MHKLGVLVVDAARRGNQYAQRDRHLRPVGV